MTTATTTKIPAPLTDKILSTADRWREHLLAQRRPELPVTATVTDDDDAHMPNGMATPSQAPPASEGIRPTSDGKGLVLDHTTFDVTKHDGMITILNTGTGNHRTFKIESQPTDATFAPGRRIVSLLIGPNRDCFTDWVGFAFADDFGVHIWQRKRGGEFDVLGKMLECPRRFAERGCVYMMEVACRRCGRPLSNPASVSLGVGPTCAEKM